MLLKRSFCPVNERPTTWGVALRKLSKLRFKVGSRRSAESEIKVCAPVRPVDSNGSACAVMVTAATSTAARLSVRWTAERCPSASWNGALFAASKPSARTSSV